MNFEFEAEFLGKKMQRLFNELHYARANQDQFKLRSRRELQIAAMIRTSFTISQISQSLELSKNTVNNYKQSLKKKIGAQTI